METKVTPRSQTRSIREEPPLNPNEQVLLQHVELAKHFWEDGHWIITNQRFTECLSDLGYEPPPTSPAPPTTDLFSQCRENYIGNEIITIQGAQLTRVRPCDLEHHEDVTDSISYALQDSLGISPLEDPSNPYESLTPHTIQKELSWRVNDCEVFLYRIVEHDVAPIQRLLDREESATEIKRALHDRQLQKTDKVAQRIIAETLQETGIQNPRYQDARFLNPPPKIVQFTEIAPASLPSSDDIRQKLLEEPNGKHLWIVEDDTQGFAIVHNNKELYIESSNPRIRGDLATLGLIKDTEHPKHFIDQLAPLRTFLRMTRRTDSFTLTFLAQDQPLPYDASAFANELAANPGAVYLKSTRTAGGELVLRHRRAADGHLILESDSHELGLLLSATLNSLKSNRTLPPILAEKTRGQILTRCSVTGMVRHALTFMETPIVEEEIPVAKYHTRAGIEKCEFRAIFQGRQNIELVASYAKASLRDVAANISIAGRGRHTVQVIRGIMQQNLKDSHDQETINKRATETLKRFEDSVTDFARKFSEELRPSHAMNDFAVDIVPVWNNAKQDLDFYLLEVQYGYRHAGLRKVDADAAKRIEAFQVALRKEYRQGTLASRLDRLFKDLA